MNDNDDDNNKGSNKRPTYCSSSKTAVPFELISCHTANPVFRSHSGGGAIGFGMSTNAMGLSLFTPAQWKELERQAMIYKYIMASVPIPHDLLFPISTTSIPDPTSPFSLSWGKLGGLVWGNNNSISIGKDAEPGRCRRTDGKKWRCSRDAAPNQKYCERHLRRGRRCSRKPVESPISGLSALNSKHTSSTTSLHQTRVISGANINSKKSNLEDGGLCAMGSKISVCSSRCGVVSSELKCCGGAATASEALLEGHHMGGKGLSFEPIVSLTHKYQTTSTTIRGTEWTLNNEGSAMTLNTANQAWQYVNAGSLGGPFQVFGDEGPYKTAYPYLSDSVECNKSQSSFIDAWSNTGGMSDKDNTTMKSSSLYANGNNISLETAALLGEGDHHRRRRRINEEEMCHVQMELDLFNSCDGSSSSLVGCGDNRMKGSSHWLGHPAMWAQSSTPGGPLAEVLRPGVIPASELALYPSSLDNGNVNRLEAATAANTTAAGAGASSPSGVIQRTLASFSDSSGASSPTTCENMKGKSEIPFQWLI